MRREDIINLHRNRKIDTVRIMPAPSKHKHWILFFEETEGRSYFLLNENGEVSLLPTTDSAIAELQDMGFKWAEIRF